jgi:alanine dehydrogenase
VKPAFGLRREDKNAWERRAPLTPDHVAELVADHGLDAHVQPSQRRAFPDKDYAAAGGRLTQDLTGCNVVLGVKEIPRDELQPGSAYVCFSHVIKGQAPNMPTLRRLLELGSTLVDYEPIVDRRDRRLIFFGRHAGYAGVVDSLWALGQRLCWEGLATPFESIRRAHQYADLEEALSHVARVGERIRHAGLPPGLRPIVFALAGSGNVAQGATEVLERLPFQDLEPEELAGLREDRSRPRNVVFKTLLQRRHRVVRARDGGFEAGEYAEHPERYRSGLDAYLRHLSVLVNGAYWEPGLPRLLTREHVRELWQAEEQPKLRVVGDIGCDVGGGVEINVGATDPGDPVYVYDPSTGRATPGVAGRGPVVMAVDNLPCEFPTDASQHFGDSLLRYVPAMARCDWNAPFESLELPEEIRRAVIAHRGQLTPAYRGLQAHLADAS